MLYPVNDCVTPNTNTLSNVIITSGCNLEVANSILQTNPIMFLKSTARLHNKLSQCLQTLPRSQPNVKLWPESENSKVRVIRLHLPSKNHYKQVSLLVPSTPFTDKY